MYGLALGESGSTSMFGNGMWEVGIWKVVVLDEGEAMAMLSQAVGPCLPLRHSSVWALVGRRVLVCRM